MPWYMSLLKEFDYRHIKFLWINHCCVLLVNHFLIFLRKFDLNEDDTTFSEELKCGELNGKNVVNKRTWTDK